MTEPARMLTGREAAELLGLSPRTLESWRNRGRGGPPWRKIGRAVRYVERDVLAFRDADVRGEVGIAVPS